MIDQHAHAGRRDEAALEAGARDQEAKETAQEVKQDLKAQSQGVTRQAKEAAEGEIDRRSTNLADRLESVGHAMRLAAEDLEGEGQEWIADYTRRAAGQVERVTRYLHDEDAPAMLTDLEDMARRNPGTFLGTSFAAGLAAGRFLRSSQADRGRGHGDGRESGSRAEDRRDSKGQVFDGVDHQERRH